MKEVKLYLEKLSVKVRQGYLTEADKKMIEQTAKAILNGPIEDCTKEFYSLVEFENIIDEPENLEIIMATHAYPGVSTRLGEALTLEQSKEIK